MASVCLPHESGTLSQRKHHRTFSRLIVSAVPFSPLWACHLEIACLPFFFGLGGSFDCLARARTTTHLS